MSNFSCWLTQGNVNTKSTFFGFILKVKIYLQFSGTFADPLADVGDIAGIYDIFEICSYLRYFSDQLVPVLAGCNRLFFACSSIDRIYKRNYICKRRAPNLMFFQRNAEKKSRNI